MIDIKSFVLKLPSFLERSYFITPGIVSVVFKIIWSIFTFCLISLSLHYGLTAVGSKTDQKSLWNFYRNYNQIQSISNGRWGDMLFNLPSLRVICGFCFWCVIYISEVLFSLSINNDYITHYNGTNCIGRVDDYQLLRSSMFKYAPASPLPQNSTILRRLLDIKQVGNIALLGNGMFAVSPPDALYVKDQNIGVSRAGLNCNTTILSDLLINGYGAIYGMNSTNGTTVKWMATSNFANITFETDLQAIAPGYVDLRRLYNVESNSTDDTVHFLVFISNPYNNWKYDVNRQLYNSSVFLNDCTLFYEQGSVTILNDGYLNESNVAGSFKKVDNKTLDDVFQNSYIDQYFDLSKTFLSPLDYPDTFLDRIYNKTYIETLKTVNDIVAAYFLNGINFYDDPCVFNKEQVPVYISVLGTKMSFGYIIIGIAFSIMSIMSLYVAAFTMFNAEERHGWLLYTRDWLFAGYITSGDLMDKNEFKKYAKNSYIKEDSSSKALEIPESDTTYLKTLLN